MKFRPISLVVLGLALAASAGHAQTSDAKVDSLVSQVATAYHGLNAFSITINSTITSGSVERKITTYLTLQKTTKLAAEIVIGKNHSRIVADGKTIYTDTTRDKTRYIHQPETSVGSAVNMLSRNGGVGLLLPVLLTSSSLEKDLFPGNLMVMREADETVGTEACDVIAAILGEGERATQLKLAFSKQDHLLRQLMLGPIVEGAKPLILETYSDVNLHPAMNMDTFTYTPRAGAVASDPPKVPPRYDPRLKVGVLPLPISGSDLAGKPVSLEQYKGKVLLLDFWATWCGPCVAELPNVIAAYKKYHGKGFDIVGISLDQANSQAKVTSFIQEKGMPWRQICDGKCWQAANAKAYGVMSIPFTLLVGTDGKIAAVGARGEDLAPAIEAALNKH